MAPVGSGTAVQVKFEPLSVKWPSSVTVPSELTPEPE